MIRVTSMGGPSPTLRIDGTLTSATLGELEAMLASLPVAGLHLDLAGLRFVDADGVARLRELRRLGAVVAGGSSFVHELIKETDK